MNPRVLRWAGAVAAVLVLAGCGGHPVELEPAPTASDPVCARALLAMPDELNGVESRDTTTQSSRAWGTPPITVRCGVEPPGPTTDRCIDVTDAQGNRIDWVMAEFGDEGVEEGTWKFTTFGREPAFEVIVPVEQAGADQTSPLIDLGIQIAKIPATRECL